MTTLSQQLPVINQPDSTEDPKLVNNVTNLLAWANGSIDGVNVVASLTGRRLVGQASAFVGPGVTTGTYFIVSDGTLLASAGSTTKPVMWWDLDPANYSVVGKSNTTALIRISVATNNPSFSTCGVAGNLNAVTWGGLTGNISPTIGASQGSASLGSLSSNASAVAEQSFPFPSAGGYAPIVQVTGITTPANTAMSILWQLFVLNS